MYDWALRAQFQLQQIATGKALLNPQLKRNALVYVDPQNTSVIEYNSADQTFSFYHAIDEIMNLGMYISGEHCFGGDMGYRIDKFCIKTVDSKYVPPRVRPSTC